MIGNRESHSSNVSLTSLASVPPDPVPKSSDDDVPREACSINEQDHLTESDSDVRENDYGEREAESEVNEPYDKAELSSRSKSFDPPTPKHKNVDILKNNNVGKLNSSLSDAFKYEKTANEIFDEKLARQISRNRTR